MDEDRVREIFKEEFEKAKEQILLTLPFLTTELVNQKIAQEQIKTKFYSDNRDFIGKEKIVASVISELEGKNPGIKYDRLLEMSAPVIRERIKTIGTLDTKKADKPFDLSFGDL